jgi:hypothetical protein
LIVADLDAVSTAPLVLAQMCELRAIAATEIEYAAFGPYPVGDLL